MTEPAEQTRVAILGGGVGAVVAAFELTRPELGNRFKVTIYQPGWRLGGKGASGRNMQPGKGMRIEEHGLHVWFGFYENAFEVMRDAYEELRTREGGTKGWWRSAVGRLVGRRGIETVWDAFKGCDEVIVADRQGTGWRQFRLRFPTHPGTPGDGNDEKAFWEIAEELAGRQFRRWRWVRWLFFLREAWRPTFWFDTTRRSTRGHRFNPPWLASVASEVGVPLRRRHYRTGAHLPRLAQALAAHRGIGRPLDTKPAAEHPQMYAELLIAFRDFLWEYYVSRRIERDPRLRFFFTTFDAWACGTAGLIKDGVLQQGYDVINDHDLCDWLRDHGAKEVTIGRTPSERSPALRALYDLTFSYRDGDLMRPTGAAGTGISNTLRLAFGYAGHYMYKMQAGMGDAVFAPLYRVLRARGVAFRFFHAATRLRLSDDKLSIAAIDVVRQAQLSRDRTEYTPVKKLNRFWYWPSEPFWDQLSDGPELAHRLGDASRLELEADPLGNGEVVTLRRGAAENGFDHVVLGISIGGLRTVCAELIQHNARFRAMIDSMVTTPTQAFQLWLRKPARRLGWKHTIRSAASTFVEPLDTYCDMSHLIASERWPRSARVRSIAYFCGALDKRRETQAEATERVKANARKFLSRDIGVWWPRAIDHSGRINPELLVSDDCNDPMDAQYYRANVSGTELYVLFPPGTIDLRLPSDDSGFENLVLAGDWTRNGIDGGCVEAAALSGRQAARKLTGITRKFIGEERMWLT